MSSFNILENPNEKETSTILDIRACLTKANVSENSAIDEYEEISKKLIVLAAKADEDNNKLQIRLLVLGLVSSCEYYIRRVLSETVLVCPLSRTSCLKQTVKYSAATYFSAHNIGLALTDDSVFSSAENIVNETKRLTGLNINDSDSLKSALTEYQKVCIIRHATVHSYGFIGGKNFSELSLDTTDRSEVALTFTSFQEIADVCLNLVRAYNGQMWTSLLSRMISKEALTFNSSESDILLFAKSVSIFWSKIELNKFQNTEHLYRKISENLKQTPPEKIKKEKQKSNAPLNSLDVATNN